MSELPYAVDLGAPLTYDELEVLKRQYEVELERGFVTTQTKFNYAWGLVKSPVREHQAEGVQLLVDIYRTDANRRRECLYYLSLGNFKLGEYATAKKFNDLLLEKEPANLQARSLGMEIDKKVTQEGYIGMALVGGAAAIGAILVAGLIRRAARSS